MKKRAPKRKPKKPRRVVLGVGYPWFGSELGERYCNVSLLQGDQWTPAKTLKIADLGNYNKIRLVAEVLK